MRRRPPAAGEPRGPDDETLPVIEETATVAKETVETGKVRVETREHREPRELNAQLDRHSVVVERVPRDEMVDERPTPQRQGDTFIFPVAEEVLIVETRWRLVEEVHVRTVRDRIDETVDVELARQDVAVERSHSQGGEGAAG